MQHGQPLRVVDMGETMLDEETFDDYLQELSEIYTADKVCYVHASRKTITNRISSIIFSVGD